MYNFDMVKSEKRFKDFISDKLQWGSCVIALIMLFSHLYQFFDSGHKIDCLIRVIFCGVYIPVVLITGRKFISWLFLIFGLTILQFSTFNNYSAFFIICLCCYWNPKLKYQIPVLIAYVISAIIVCTWHDKSVVHLVIHLVNCFCFYFMGMILFTSKAKTKKLQLTDDEHRILMVLSRGEQQKSIEFFSKNTVTKKINDAMIRNDCQTKEELLMKFIAEKKCIGI